MSDQLAWKTAELHCASIYSGSQTAQKNTMLVIFRKLSLMPDPLEALIVVAKHVKPGGRVYITQTFQRHGFWGLSIIKPLVKYVDD